MALCLEQDSSIFRVDDINTFVITYFFSEAKKSDGEEVKTPVFLITTAASHKNKVYILSGRSFKLLTKFKYVIFLIDNGDD